MNVASIIQRLMGIKRYIPPAMTCYRDDDLGNYKFCPMTHSWFLHRPFKESSILVRGRSESPTSLQKQLLERFTPRLDSLTAESARMLRPPEEAPAHEVPAQLILRELRFESGGEVELFFFPEIEVDSLHLWPMATCSQDGYLLSTEWTT